MVVKQVKNIENIETREEKIDLSLFKKKSSSRTPAGMIRGYAKKLSNSKGNLFTKMEMLALFAALHKEITAIEKVRMRPIVELEIVEGWKGKDKLNINKGFDNDFFIIEHRKDKESGEVYDVPHLIPYENLNKILWMVSKLKINESTNYREIVSKIIKINDLQVGLNAFNGGHNRAKYYFPLYYFPVKILESLKVIKYSGRGDIIRLK